jgi:hypothetical protein
MKQRKRVSGSGTGRSPHHAGEGMLLAVREGEVKKCCIIEEGS